MMKTFYKLILFVLLIIGYSLVHTSAYATVITCDTMVADDSTDNSSALRTCMTAAEGEAEKQVNIPQAQGVYKFTSTLTVPEDVTIYGVTNVRLRGKLKLSDRSVLDNLEFEDNDRMVILGDIGGSSYITGAVVRNSTFNTASWTAIFAGRVNECTFDNNTFMNTDDDGSNITILGGKRNRVTNNHIYGGKTAIIFKYSRLVNNGGYESLMEDNLVEGNTIHDVVSHQYEEGISFDIVGDDPKQVATLEYDTVFSIKDYQVTLSHANWAPTGNPSYVGYDMVFLSGDLIGQTRRITAQSSATFTLDKSVSGAASGDKIVIGATFKRNIIRNNSVNSPNLDDAILLYGMAFNNRIEGNTIATGANISVRSLDNVVRSKDSVTGSFGRAPCGYNLVKDNNVGYQISLEYYAIPVIQGHANTYSPYYSYGNSVINNEVGNRIWANYQYSRFCGNTGTKEFYHVTLLDESPPDLADGICIGIDPPRGLRIL